MPRSFTEVQEVLQKFVSVQQGVAPMYKKNIGLALLELAFSSPTSLLPPSLDPSKPSYRVIQLYLFIEQNLLQRATFDDVKEYVSQLTFEEAKYFVKNLSNIVTGKVSPVLVCSQALPRLTRFLSPDPRCPETVGRPCS